MSGLSGAASEAGLEAAALVTGAAGMTTQINAMYNREYNHDAIMSLSLRSRGAAGGLRGWKVTLQPHKAAHHDCREDDPGAQTDADEYSY
jgi:hypothetical protein